jgi:type I restriction enzyme S subunit
MTDLDIGYMQYVLGSKTAFLLSRGLGTTFLELTTDALGSVRVPNPPLPAQRVVSDYLDVETARIDAFIAKKRHMIDLQEERYRTAIDVTMSGPNWPLVPLGRFVTRISQGASPQAANRPAEPGEWGVLKLSAVKYGRFVPGENKALAPDAAVDWGLVPKVGDLLLTRSNTPAYVGDAAAVTHTPGRVLLCDLIYRLTLDHRLQTEFAAAALLTTRARHHLSSRARGTSQSMVKLRGDDVKATRVPFPPLAEQARAVEVLDRKRILLDETRAVLERQIDLLVEHRRTLITAAVTGELDIPGVAA